jgi:nucleoside-diphosphate-sugar epimerase
MSTVLVTGAAGGVARLLLPALRPAYDLVLLDRAPVEAAEGVRVLRGDLTDPDVAAAAVSGVDAVVHLAANPNPCATWPQLHGPNVLALTNLLDAAAGERVGRIVLASSVHAMGQYLLRPTRPIDPVWTPRPCCRYGATKVFAEAAARAYAYQYGLSAICLRLGGTFEKPWNTGMLGGWLAPADLQRLVIGALTAEIEFGIYHGISANTRSEWNIENARAELGYQPIRDSEIFASIIPVSTEGGLCTPDAS